MGYKNIEKKSIGYTALAAYARLMNNYFYKKIEVNGKENIPPEGPVIFAANHQNALTDALSVLLSIDHQPVFLARSDIFKGSIVRGMLYFIKILPIYRMRDGISNLKNNDEIFEKTVHILEKKRYLALFPEGTHAGLRKLRMLQKGITRIAFLAEERFDFNLGLKIIPVGIDYSHYSRVRGTLFVNFGEPIFVKDYKEVYEENQQQGMNELRKVIREKIRKQMIDIRNEEHYEAILALRKITNKRVRESLNLLGSNLFAQFQADKIMTEMLNEYSLENPDDMKEISNQVNDYLEGVESLKIQDWVFHKEKYSILGICLRLFLLFLTSPIALYGFLTNFLPHFFIERFVQSKIEDKQFHSSFRFALYLFILPFYYLIATFALSFVFSGWWLLFFGLAMPISGFYTQVFYSIFTKLKIKWRYTLISSGSKVKTLKEMRETLNHKIVNLLQNKKSSQNL